MKKVVKKLSLVLAIIMLVALAGCAGRRSAPAEELAVAEEPALSSEELKAQQLEQEIMQIKAKLAELDAADDTEGALSYLTEQLEFMKFTYETADLEELEQLRDEYVVRYRQKTVTDAKTAFDNNGYQAAMDILYHATQLLGGEDEEINSAMKAYEKYGPQSFDEYYDNYLYADSDTGMWSLDYEVKDNLGTEYPSAVQLYADGYSHVPSTYVYQLTGKQTKLSGLLFLGYRSRSTDSVLVVRIYGDDNLLWQSPDMTKGVLPVELQVDLTGYSQLKIESEVIREGSARVYLANGMLSP